MEGGGGQKSTKKDYITYPMRNLISNVWIPNFDYQSELFLKSEFENWKLKSEEFQRILNYKFNKNFYKKFSPGLEPWTCRTADPYHNHYTIKDLWFIGFGIWIYSIRLFTQNSFDFRENLTFPFLILPPSQKTKWLHFVDHFQTRTITCMTPNDIFPHTHDVLYGNNGVALLG